MAFQTLPIDAPPGTPLEGFTANVGDKLIFTEYPVPSQNPLIVTSEYFQAGESKFTAIAPGACILIISGQPYVVLVSGKAPYTPSINTPQAIETIIQGCVQRVSDMVSRSILQIKPITFFYGHPLEIKNTLAEWGKAAATKDLKFPCIMLFADIKRNKSTVKGGFEDVRLNMIIANSTQATYKASERITKNFVPILRPIFQALIHELCSCGFFWVQSERQLLGYEIERLYWGRENIQAGGNTGNAASDYLDAIEINNLPLTLCRPGNMTLGNIVPSNGNGRI